MKLDEKSPLLPTIVIAWKGSKGKVSTLIVFKGKAEASVCKHGLHLCKGIMPLTGGGKKM